MRSPSGRDTIASLPRPPSGAGAAPRRRGDRAPWPRDGEQLLGSVARVNLSGRVPSGTNELVARLEPSQRTAVLADEPVVCVLAGAGTGKTRVLTLRVAHRIEEGSAHPSSVLVCTFSRKAAEELRHRLWALGDGSRVEAGTIHRTALRLITQYRSDRALPPPAIVADRKRFLAELDGDPADSRRPRRGPAGVRDEHRGGRAPRRAFAARLDGEIGWAKARLVRPDEYVEAARRVGRRPPLSAEDVADAYARYESVRARRGLLDLDDLVWHCVDLLDTDASFQRGVRWRHRHLFVDEAQDLNEAQFRLLRLLAGDDPDLFVVGDPDQSVYGWNGADPAILDRLTREYAGTRVVRLRANHRCSPQVLRVAVAALGATDAPPASTRPPGRVPRVVCLGTDEEEARWIARHVWLAHSPGRRWSSIAVLARTNAQLESLSKALEAERIPHRLAGIDLGPASDLAAGAEAARRESQHRPDRPPVGAAPGGTGPTIDDHEDADSGEDGEEPGAGVPTTPRPKSAGGPDADAVVLSTFHRAKGLQWRSVFVTGLSDGIVPLVSARTATARAEERRLLYVALTRAEDELTCSWSLHAGVGAPADARARRPSPWLRAIEDAADDDRAPDLAPAADVAEHLARVRSRLVTSLPGSDPPPAPDVPEARTGTRSGGAS